MMPTFIENCPEKFIAKIQAVFPVAHIIYIESQKILGGGQQMLAKISTIFIIYKMVPAGVAQLFYDLSYIPSTISVSQCP